MAGGAELEGLADVTGADAAALLEVALSDNPEAYLPRDRRHALAEGRELPDRVHGAALFADISGFTPLTEALAAELGPQRGAEELTATLNGVFHAIIAELDRFGGDVIYFSGDAITCWINGDDGRRAAACALAMQETMARVGDVRTPAGRALQLAMKVAVAVGPARRFVAGDPEVQLIDVLAGSLIDELAAAEGLAERGEVVLEQSALESLGPLVEVSEIRLDEQGGRTAGLLQRICVHVADAQASEPEQPLPEELVRPWLLPAVYERLRTGRGEFLAELRPAIPVFVRFTGIDYDEDDAAPTKLDQFIRRTQRIFAAYGGNLLQLTLGDKGAYLYAVFGSPLAHEDDAARAASAALEILELDGETAAREIQIGIAHGRLRSGTYGHVMRRTFVCLGDAVNLSARLMSKAAPGRAVVSEAVREMAGDAFGWEQMPDMIVKGKSEPIRAFALVGSRGDASRRRRRYDLALVGRRTELEVLLAALARVESGSGEVVGISADAGMGKSRLVAEFVRQARAERRLVAFGECQAFGSSSSYAVWREIWRTLFGIDGEAPEPEQVEALEHSLGSIDPSLVARAPLLGAVLALDVPENVLTRGLEAELRKTSLESLLTEALRARAREPLVLVLEDCHWIDALSRDLLETLARAAASLPVLIVLAYRPAADRGGDLHLHHLPHFGETALSELQPDEAEQLIRMRLEAESAEPPRALIELVTERAEGNPFYIEELLNYVQGRGVDLADERALAELEVPESLNSLILSRIDTLSEERRRTLKVASVMGRTFLAPALPAVYPDVGSLDQVREHLGVLQSADLVRLDREDEEVYIFKHVVTRDVAYESMPFALRSLLHEHAGDYLERSEADAIERNLDLLAHHYWHSRNDDKKREYLVLAGEAAKAKYANAAAIDYFERAVPLLEGSELTRTTRRLGEVLETSGEIDRAARAYRDALALAETAGDDSSAGWAETSLAELARKHGDYEESAQWLVEAERHFDHAHDRLGHGRVLHVAGILANVRGDQEAARRHWQASLEIRREAGDKAAMGAMLSNLAMLAEYEGDAERSCQLHEEGLALRIDAGDVVGIAISKMNLGVMLSRVGRVDEGRALQEQSLELRREIGDPRMIALAEHNLGILTRAQEDYEVSRSLFASALRVQREQGDRWALAFMLDDVAVLAVLLDEPEQALRLAGAGHALREAIAAPRGPAEQLELERHLSAAREALGESADSAWDEGVRLPLDEALDEALALCAR